MITWTMLGIHRKACGVLNIDGYYNPLLAMFDRGVTDGFIQSEHRKIVLQDKDPERLIEALLSYDVPSFDKWGRAQVA